MARALETLKGLETTPAILKPAGEPVTPAPTIKLFPSQPMEDPTASMSFIEVGPNHSMIASPDVLACTPPSRNVAAPPVAPVVKKVAPVLDTAPTVSFHPWKSTGPTHQLDPALLAYHQPKHPVSQHYCALAEQLFTEETQRVFLLMAASPRIGTTTTLLNLVLTTCLNSPRRVAVLDLNWTAPSLATKLGLASTPCLQDVLAKTLPLEQALQPTILRNLSALVLASPHQRPLVGLTAEALWWIFAWLRERFDVVFVDGPLWEDRSEMTALLTSCDAIFPVTVATEQHLPHVQQMVHTLARRSGRVRGLLHVTRTA